MISRAALGDGSSRANFVDDGASDHRFAGASSIMVLFLYESDVDVEHVGVRDCFLERVRH